MASPPAPDLDQGYEVVQRDQVPTPQPKADASLDERIAELRTWLQPTNYLSAGSEFKKHLNSYAEGTGKWQQSSKVLRSWMGHDETPPDGPPTGAGCLHARGVAGSGKSVFAATTIRRLQDAGHVVLFFFFRQIVDKNHSAKYLVRDFAAQLLPHCPSFVHTLSTISQEIGVDGNEMDVVWPALVKALASQRNLQTGRVYCVVDALDEMDDDDFDDMVDKLAVLGTATESHATVMITSRPLPKIEKALSGPGVSHLKLDPEILYPDVARYIDARMASLATYLGQDKMKLVRNAICDRASGLFLHARLAADNLAEGLTDGRITAETLPASLDRIPRSLTEVYENMLQEHARRSSVTSEQQAKILTCVVHASRPLRLIELGSLVSRMLQLDLRRGKELVRAACGRLLEILEDESVSVIHHSFTEFLKDESRKSVSGSFPVLEHVSAHAMLAILSFEYLDTCPKFDTTIDDKRVANYEIFKFSDKEEHRRTALRTEVKTSNPLVSYVTDNLVFHLGKAAGGDTTKILQCVDQYFVKDRPAFQNWILFHWRHHLSASINIMHLGTALYEATALPLFIMAHFATKHPELVDVPDNSDQTPLAYAAEAGFADKVDFLLAHDADPTRPCSKGLTALHLAAYRGHADVVRKLLDFGVDPLIKSGLILREYNRYEGWWEEFSEAVAEGRRETAATHALHGDHPAVVAMFLPFMPDSELSDLFHRTRDLEIAKSMLDTGKVDVNSYSRGQTKLYSVISSYTVDMVKLLLAKGADPMKRCARQRYYGHEEDGGHEIEKKDRKRGPTPLHALADPRTRSVVMEGDEAEVQECLRIMIAAGADVNATMDPEYGASKMTPLHLAVQKTNDTWGSWGSLDETEEILTAALLAAGADPTAKNSDGDTPIHLVNVAKPKLLKLLMQNGGGKVRNAHGRPPLFQMIHGLSRSSSWTDSSIPNTETFESFWDPEDIDLVDDDGNDVIHHIMHSISGLSRAKDTSFIAKVLGAGPDLNRKNKKGITPLWRYRCCDAGYHRRSVDDEGILRMMIEAGMDLNARNAEGRSILWELTNFDVAITQKFVKLGTDPKIIDNNGDTLLNHVIREGKSIEWIEYLASTDIDVLHKNKKGNNLIHELIATGYHSDSEEAIKKLRLLIRAGVSPLATNSKKESALHMVKTDIALELVLEMPEFQALDINQPDGDGWTPLYHLLELGPVTAGKVIDKGGNPTIVALDGTSLLHLAAQERSANTLLFIVSQLEKRSVLPNFIDASGRGRTPLHLACESGDLEKVRILLQYGANPSSMDQDGLTPLHAVAEVALSIRYNNYRTHADEIVGLFEKAGADLRASASRTDVKSPSDELQDTTPMAYAVKKGRWDMVRALLRRGVVPSAFCRESADFAVGTDKAAAAQKTKELQALEESNQSEDKHVSKLRRLHWRVNWRGRWCGVRADAKGAMRDSTQVFVFGGQIIHDIRQVRDDSNIQADASSDKDFWIDDALESLLVQGDYDSIEEYVQLGGDISSPGEDGGQFLHNLVHHGHYDLLEHYGDAVRRLQHQGHSASEDGQKNRYLLRDACMRSEPSLHLIQLLVEGFGEDLNQPCQWDNYDSHQTVNPIHILARAEHFWQIEALEYVLAKGANVEGTGSEGLTPLAITLSGSRGHWSVDAARILLRHGANPHVKVKPQPHAINLVHLLEMSRHPVTTQLLLDHGAKVDDCPGLLQRMIDLTMDPEIVRCLLAAGVDPNHRLVTTDTDPNATEEEDGSPDDDAYSAPYRSPSDELNDAMSNYALHQAACPSKWTPKNFDSESRQRAIIELLISHGARTSALYEDSSSVLHMVVQDRGNFEALVQYLRDSDLNALDARGRTLLACACQPSPTIVLDTVLRLLSFDAVNAQIPDADGKTPLHLLCTYSGSIDESFQTTFASLVERAPRAITMRDKEGRTPIQLALRSFASHRARTSIFIIRHLIKSGARITEPDPVTGDTALHLLAPCMGGEERLARDTTDLFREVALEIDINTLNAAGETPCASLLAAHWKGTMDPEGQQSHPYYAKENDISHAKALDVLIDLGADHMVVDSKERNLLHVTVARDLGDNEGCDWHDKEDLAEVFKKLMDLGVDPRKENDDLRTAIDIAVARDLYDVTRLFEKNKRTAEEEDLEGCGNEMD